MKRIVDNIIEVKSDGQVDYVSNNKTIVSLESFADSDQRFRTSPSINIWKKGEWMKKESPSGENPEILI